MLAWIRRRLGVLWHALADPWMYNTLDDPETWRGIGDDMTRVVDAAEANRIMRGLGVAPMRPSLQQAALRVYMAAYWYPDRHVGRRADDVGGPARGAGPGASIGLSRAAARGLFYCWCANVNEMDRETRRLYAWPDGYKARFAKAKDAAGKALVAADLLRDVAERGEEALFVGFREEGKE